MILSFFCDERRYKLCNQNKPFYSSMRQLKQSVIIRKIHKGGYVKVVRQILLVRNHRQDFLHAKKRNPGYD